MSGEDAGSGPAVTGGSLREHVLAAIERDESLTASARLWVAAALAGGSKWEDAVSTGEPPAWVDGTVASEVAHAAGSDVVYYLRGLEVAGFRGVGRSATLSFDRQPGLTVVTGRNGSGKSSFAEGLEVALTGSSYRMDSRSGVWMQQWRNLHHPAETRVEAEFSAVSATGGSERCLTVTVTWDAEATLAGGSVEVLVDGTLQPGGREALGLTRALELYRPLLTHEELGALLNGKPSELHDALYRVLGLDALDDALKRLKALKAGQSAEPEAARSAMKAAVAAAEKIAETDPRAREVRDLLKKRAPDRAALLGLTRGVTRPPDDLIRVLDSVCDWCEASLAMLDPEVVRSTAQRVRAAEALEREVTAPSAQHAAEGLDLLTRAVGFFRADEQERECPVCQVGALDAMWLERAETRIREEQERLRDVTQAQSENRSAQSAARSLITGPVRPAALADSAAHAEWSWLASLREAVGAWQVDAVGHGLADHLDRELVGYRRAIDVAHEAASQERTRRLDAWAPVADAVRLWATAAEKVEQTEPQRTAVTQAFTWLDRHMKQIKDERLAPLSEEAGRIWGELRQESSVALGPITLEGQATSRKVNLSAHVDDEEATALAVMSQGELYALALALFLPRVARPESPFRFLVLDDPIQAMDPAKVAGFVNVLSGLAETYQVIVFSHDDRLPATLRRSGKPGRVVEVYRGQESSVQARLSATPAQRHLSDARALAMDESLPEETLRRALPMLLRSAVEAAARDRFFDTALRSGWSLASCEREWEADPRTSTRLRLGLGMDQAQFNAWLGQAWRRQALGVCTRAAHDGLSGDPQKAMDDVRHVVRELEQRGPSTAAESPALI